MCNVPCKVYKSIKHWSNYKDTHISNGFHRRHTQEVIAKPGIHNSSHSDSNNLYSIFLISENHQSEIYKMLAKPLILSYVFHMSISNTRWAFTYVCLYVCEHLPHYSCFWVMALWSPEYTEGLCCFVLFYFALLYFVLLCFSNQFSD